MQLFDRRKNWISETEDIKTVKERQRLTDCLNSIRKQIDELPRTKGNMEIYDQLQSEKRNIMAQLAVIATL